MHLFINLFSNFFSPSMLVVTATSCSAVKSLTLKTTTISQMAAPKWRAHRKMVNNPTSRVSQVNRGFGPENTHCQREMHPVYLYRFKEENVSNCSSEILIYRVFCPQARSWLMSPAVSRFLEKYEQRFAHRLHSGTETAHNVLWKFMHQAHTHAHTHCSSPDPALPTTSDPPACCYDKAESGGDISAFTFLLVWTAGHPRVPPLILHTTHHTLTHTHTLGSHQSLSERGATSGVNLQTLSLNYSQN